MAESWTRKAPSYVVLGSSIAALICFAIGVSSKWSSGEIKLPNATGGVVGMRGSTEWDLNEFTLAGGATKLEWESVFKFYDEGTFACDTLFTSEGGVVGSTASSQVVTSIDSCTSSRSDFDRVDTVMRLTFLALAIAAFGALCGLSVIALAAQENGADLWLPGLYTAVSTVLSFCLAISSVAMYSTTLSAATDTDQADWLVLAYIAATSGATATTVEGSAFTDGSLEQSTEGGFVAVVVAVVFMAFASIASVYDLYIIRVEAQEEEAAKEAEAAAEENKKAALLAKNRAAAEAQAKRVAELQESTGAAAEGKKDKVCNTMAAEVAAKQPSAAEGKYPSTPHLPFSPGVNSDDKLGSSCLDFLKVPIVVTEKLDGGNCCIVDGKVFARTHIKQVAQTIKYTGAVPEGTKLFGENMFGIHSIEYDGLKSAFYLFGVQHPDGSYGAWEEVVALAEATELPTVPVVFQGEVRTDKELKDLIETSAALPSAASSSTVLPEGFVVRVADGFQQHEFERRVIKYVRANHVQTDATWLRTWKKASISYS